MPGQLTKKSRIECGGMNIHSAWRYTRIEHLAGGAAYSIRQAWADARENDGREGANVRTQRADNEGAKWATAYGRV